MPALLIDGTHKAVDAIQHYMQIYKRQIGDFWILKCDIKRFFYSINPHILFEILKKQITDKKLLDFTYHLIFDNRDEPVGIPIGNYTSQFFANIYLNELDQYIKHTLKVRYYVRYMDDFILLLDTKQKCIDTKKKIEIFIAEHLQLELNHKSRYYPSNQGLNFCGFRIFPTHRLLRTRSKTKIKCKIRRWNKYWLNGNINYKIVIPSLQSWLGHALHCNSYTIKKKMLHNCKFLYREDVDYTHYTSDIAYDETLKSEFLDYTDF